MTDCQLEGRSFKVRQETSRLFPRLSLCPSHRCCCCCCRAAALPRCLLLSSLIQPFASACSSQIFFINVAERSEGNWMFCTSLGRRKAAGPLSASGVLPLKHIMSKSQGTCVQKVRRAKAGAIGGVLREARLICVSTPQDCNSEIKLFSCLDSLLKYRCV